LPCCVPIVEQPCCLSGHDGRVCWTDLQIGRTVSVIQCKDTVGSVKMSDLNPGPSSARLMPVVSHVLAACRLRHVHPRSRRLPGDRHARRATAGTPAGPERPKAGGYPSVVAPSAITVLRCQDLFTHEFYTKHDVLLGYRQGALLQLDTRSNKV
jgi:hypothetical protein